MQSKFNPAEATHLFHGTIENLEGPLRPGSYDGVFWTAESSAVAQCYIPATGGSTYISIRSYQLDEKIRPSQTDLFGLARMVGPVPYDFEFNDRGEIAGGWRCPEGCVTYRDIVQYVENTLGYKNSSGFKGDYMFEILTDGWSKEHGSKIVAAGYKKPGSLVVVDGFQNMRFLDMSTGDSDLLDLQYHKLESFRRAEEEGFDGVIIDDFAQSKTWGNVSHRSIGFFASSLAKIRTEVIPCVRFDWDEKDIHVKDTPEYLTWARARMAQTAVADHVATLAASKGALRGALA